MNFSYGEVMCHAVNSAHNYPARVGIFYASGELYSLKIRNEIFIAISKPLYPVLSVVRHSSDQAVAVNLKGF